MNAHIKHLAIAALIVAVVLLAAWKYFAFAGNVAHDQKVLAEERLKEDLDKAKIQAQATATDKQALQAQLNALSASNAALQRDLATLRAQLANQRQQDAAMPPDALSLRWSDLINLPGQIQPSGAGFNVTLEAGHETVREIEEIPVLKAEKAKLEENSGLKDAALIQANKTLADTEAERDTCKNKTVPDTQHKCDLEKDELKQKARKRNIVLSVLAAIGGFLLRSKI